MNLESFFTEEVSEDILTEDPKQDIADKEANEYWLSELAGNEWKNFAIYTIENRAIPNMISGLKPVQNFYLHASINMTKTKFDKVAAVGSSVAILGYHHGEGSAQGAGQLMAAEWNNVVPLIQGRGSFGTRLVQSASAPRYTFTKLHDNFYKYFKDLDIAPVHPDVEHIPPRFYVPIVPMVLANGIRGIATGFAVSILPRNPTQLAEACRSYLKTGKIKQRPDVMFPHFSGKTWYVEEEGRFYWEGTFERNGKTGLTITEIPYDFDRETYVEILDKLEENDKIVSYEDKCGKEGFKFSVRLKNENQNWTDDDIVREFKLRKMMTENITVIDYDGKLREYADELDLIKDFCDWRLEFLNIRIKKNQDEISEDIRWMKVKKQFIESVLDDKIVFKGKGKVQVVEQIEKLIVTLPGDSERLLRISIVSLVKELIIELDKQIAEAEKNLEYWNTTTTKDQFLLDLKGL